MFLYPGAFFKSKFLPAVSSAFLLLFLAFPSALHAQDHEDFDQYKLRITTLWFYSIPSGSLHGTNVSDASIDFQRDLGFNSYSTFAAEVDWKFTRKNHFYVAVSRYNSSRQKTLERTFTFQGNTFTAGLVTRSDLHALLVTPGYQYDIIRRKRGHLGIGAQLDLFDSSAKIFARAQVVNGEQVGPVTASGSLVAPIPVLGPQYRFYLTNSPRIFFDGNVYGMYFFGYGSFISTADTLGVTLNKHFNLQVGYQLGSRLKVTNDDSTGRIGLRLTQQGAITGLQFSF
jgi:hypothetical protein